MELGKQIKKYRQESQLSQEELANRVYVSRQTISNWENDKSYPDVTSGIVYHTAPQRGMTCAPPAAGRLTLYILLFNHRMLDMNLYPV